MLGARSAPVLARGGKAARPPCRKRVRTRSTVSRLRKTTVARSATERPWWASKTICARRRRLAWGVVSYNGRSSVTWVSDNGDARARALLLRDAGGHRVADG